MSYEEPPSDSGPALTSDPAPVRDPALTKVIVTNVDISFLNLVGLLVKLAFAAIPAAIIIGLVIAVILAVLAPTVPLSNR